MIAFIVTQALGGVCSYPTLAEGHGHTVRLVVRSCPMAASTSLGQVQPPSVLGLHKNKDPLGDAFHDSAL